MTMIRFRAALTLVAVATVLTVATAAQQGPPMPKPGPEHALFKMDEGTWDASIEFFPAPGAPAMASKGVEVNTIGCSGLCLITDFKGEAMGAPFAGHGVMTWDAAQKKYIGSWMDSLSFGLSTGESTYDAAASRWTGSMSSPDGSGKMIRMRSIVEVKGAATRVFTLYGPGPDGKEMMSMRITYTKRK